MLGEAEPSTSETCGEIGWLCRWVHEPHELHVPLTEPLDHLVDSVIDVFGETCPDHRVIGELERWRLDPSEVALIVESPAGSLPEMSPLRDERLLYCGDVHAQLLKSIHSVECSRGGSTYVGSESATESVWVIAGGTI